MNRKQIAGKLVRMAKTLLGKKLVALNMPDGWEELDSLPRDVQKELRREKAFRSGYGDVVFIAVKKDVDKVVDWVVMMDDGEYFKVGAEFIIWTEAGYNKAAWSGNNAKKMVLEYMKTRKMSTDPNSNIR